MEEEKLVNEFRLGDVVAQVSRYAATGGRSWLTTRVGRYYTVDGEEHLTAIDDDEEIARVQAAWEELNDGWEWEAQDTDDGDED